MEHDAGFGRVKSVAGRWGGDVSRLEQPGSLELHLSSVNASVLQRNIPPALKGSGYTLCFRFVLEALERGMVTRGNRFDILGALPTDHFLRGNGNFLRRIAGILYCSCGDKSLHGFLAGLAIKSLNTARFCLRTETIN